MMLESLHFSTLSMFSLMRNLWIRLMRQEAVTREGFRLHAFSMTFLMSWFWMKRLLQNCRQSIF
ncbi:hypothetical protein VZ52_17690 [Ralstonia mannitolilytica]|nr:hypothetical protein VZ52_17690 [Ralstonia mannitolilytica]